MYNTKYVKCFHLSVPKLKSYADDITLWLEGTKPYSSMNCLALNFGWKNVDSIDIPQIVMTLNTDKISFKHMWNHDSFNCFIVLVGGKYFQVVDEISEKVDEIVDNLNIMKIKTTYFFEKTDSGLPKTKSLMPKVSFLKTHPDQSLKVKCKGSSASSRRKVWSSFSFDVSRRRQKTN